MFLPTSTTLSRYISYDARTGRFSMGAEPLDLAARGNSFVVDFGSLEVGWELYGEPDARLLVSYVASEAFPPPPTPHHAAAMRVVVSGPPFQGARFLAGSRRVLVNAVNNLHTAYEAAPEAAEGMIPVVHLASTMAVTLPNGSVVQQPVFSILSWVARAPAFGDRKSPAPAGKLVEPVERILPHPSNGKPTPEQIMARLAERNAAAAAAKAQG